MIHVSMLATMILNGELEPEVADRVSRGLYLRFFSRMAADVPPSELVEAVGEEIEKARSERRWGLRERA